MYARRVLLRLIEIALRNASRCLKPVPLNPVGSLFPKVFQSPKGGNFDAPFGARRQREKEYPDETREILGTSPSLIGQTRGGIESVYRNDTLHGVLEKRRSEINRAVKKYSDRGPLKSQRMSRRRSSLSSLGRNTRYGNTQ